MLHPVSTDEYKAQPSKYRMRIGINITIQEEQRPDENVIDFIDRVKEKVVDVYGHLQAFDLSGANVEPVLAE